MAKRADVENAGILLVQKMFELEQAYRALDEKDRELDVLKYHGDSGGNYGTDRGMVKLEYQVARLQEKLKGTQQELDRTRGHLRDTLQQKREVERHLIVDVKEKQDAEAKMAALRIKVGVSNANYNVGRYETDQLKKKYQEGQIQLARMDERLGAANIELNRLRKKGNPVSDKDNKPKGDRVADKVTLKKMHDMLEKERSGRMDDQERLAEKESDVQQLEHELSSMKEEIAVIQMNTNSQRVSLEEERSRARDLEKMNKTLREERERFNDNLQKYKVKLGVTNAGRNVKEKLTYDMRRRDDEYKSKLKDVEKKLKLANQEIERLRLKMMPGKTASSLDTHQTRMKRTANFTPKIDRRQSLTHREPLKGTSSKRAWTAETQTIQEAA